MQGKALMHPYASTNCKTLITSNAIKPILFGVDIIRPEAPLQVVETHQNLSGVTLIRR